MSGPKRGTWRIYYDPTPTRLADLEEFAAKQDAWLARNGSFIERFLGCEALAGARAACGRVRQCIESGDPDSGFDCYGQAWELFNQLHRKAVDAKRRQEFQEQARRQLVIQEQARHRQAAVEAARGCNTLWKAPESQSLLRRWGDNQACRRLLADLDTMTTGSTKEIERRVRSWRNDFDRVIKTAVQRAEDNERAVRACVPKLQNALKSLGELNADVLSDQDHAQFDERKTAFQQKAQEALANEDLSALQSSVKGLKELATEYGPKIKAAELEKTSQGWRDALVRCGYSVVARKGPDGAIILQAGSFPMKSLYVEVRPDTEEVRLDVNGKHDHAQCVKDVHSLQAELARQGVQLTMTDWGAGKPGGVERQLTQNLSAWGAR